MACGVGYDLVVAFGCLVELLQAAVADAHAAQLVVLLVGEVVFLGHFVGLGKVAECLLYVALCGECLATCGSRVTMSAPWLCVGWRVGRSVVRSRGTRC